MCFGTSYWPEEEKFKDDAYKGIFLSYVLHTDHLKLYYDCESEHVKIIFCCKFDKGFYYLPTESVPLGFQQLIWSNHDQPIPPDPT